MSNKSFSLKNAKDLAPSPALELDLLGISSSLKEYKLAFWINRALGIQLSKQEDIEIEFLKGKKMVLSNFFYKNSARCCRLIKNRTSEGSQDMLYLLPELDRFDYLFVIQGEGVDFHPDWVHEHLKKLEKVNYIAKIEVEKLKSKDNLIF